MIHSTVAAILGVVSLSKLIVTLATPFTSNSSSRHDGSHLSVEAWHARSLTEISWELTNGSADLRDRVVIFWDKFATNVVRFGSTVNATNRLATSSSSASAGYQILPEEMGAGSSVCNYTAYETGQRNAFYSQSMIEESSVTLEDSSAWWYTSSLAQEVHETEASNQGEASVPLSDPGIYFVCLILANNTCEPIECLEVAVYQPPYDFMEVRRPKRSVPWYVNNCVDKMIRGYRSTGTSSDAKSQKSDSI